MMKTLYCQLRREYRRRLHADRQWTPDPYGPLRQARPNSAGLFLAQLMPRMREAITTRAVPRNARPARGPRAQHYLNWRPNSGRYANMNLGSRVAFRKALHTIREQRMAEMVSPIAAAAYAENDAMLALVERMEAFDLRMMAERHQREVARLRAAGLPY